MLGSLSALGFSGIPAFDLENEKKSSHKRQPKENNYLKICSETS
jgi:hypothetical protein